MKNGEGKKTVFESRARRISTVKMIGGRLCLDFANTVEWRFGENPDEQLTDVNDLISWLIRAGLITEDGLRRLEEPPGDGPAAAALYDQAIVLRETIFLTFSTIARGRPVKKSDLEAMNGFYTEAMARTRIVRTKDDYSLEFVPEGNGLFYILYPLVRSAANLLVSGELDRIRICGNEHCGGLFLDTSRNRSRRWCDMRVCGNRAKARRFYRKKRSGRDTG